MLGFRAGWRSVGLRTERLFRRLRALDLRRIAMADGSGFRLEFNARPGLGLDAGLQFFKKRHGMSGKNNVHTRGDQPGEVA